MRKRKQKKRDAAQGSAKVPHARRRLRKALREEKLSLRDAAKRIGLSKTTLQRILKGAVITIRSARKIRAFLNKVGI